MPRNYTLLYFQGDFVILTPKDILTRDETWINQHEMLERFDEISASIDNVGLRALIDNYFRSRIPTNLKAKDTDKVLKHARWETIRKYPELIEYYISKKEKEKEEAKSVADYKVRDIQQVLVSNVHYFLSDNIIDKRFYEIPPVASCIETKNRIKYFKNCIENNDGYMLFYVENKPVKRESDLKILFRFVWYATLLDVNREVNNGRVPVDYKVSYGSKDATLVGFKLASNTNQKRNLEKQLEIYQTANSTEIGIKVIMYFTDEELKKLNKVLQDLNMQNDPNVVIIDARRKKSASKEDGN